MLVKDLKAKNEKKQKKIEEIRKSQEEIETKMTRQYKKIQSTIFSHILHNKHKDLKHFKIRTTPGTLVGVKKENSVISSFRSVDVPLIE